jgi:hypothetical protein
VQDELQYMVTKIYSKLTDKTAENNLLLCDQLRKWQKLPRYLGDFINDRIMKPRLQKQSRSRSEEGSADGMPNDGAPERGSQEPNGQTAATETLAKGWLHTDKTVEHGSSERVGADASETLATPDHMSCKHVRIDVTGTVPTRSDFN